MASFFLGPDPLQSTFFIPPSNTPGNGVLLFTYVAGSVSTKTSVYKDSAGNAAYTNPIVLDSGGNLPNGGLIWIPAGVSIKAVWAPANDTDPPTSPYWSKDQLAGINDTTASVTDWIPGPQPTFISSTQFTLVGDQTATFTKSRRLKFTVTAGTVYGTISSSSFGAVTTVNVAFASGALDAGLSSVFYSLIDPALPSMNADYSDKQASTVPSAGNGTTNIWGVAGNSVHVSGTNAIFSFSSAPYVGARRKVIFDAVLGLMSSAALTMQGNLNVTTAANDIADVYAQTTSTNIISFYKASGRPVLVASGDFAAQASNTVLAGPSSGANAVPTFRNLVTGDIPGMALVYITSATFTSAVATVDFNQLSSTFDSYFISADGVSPSNGGGQLLMRMSNDGGATFKAGVGDYNYATAGVSDSGGADNSSSNGAGTAILLVGNNGTASGSSGAFGGVNFSLFLHNVNATSSRKNVSHSGSHVAAAFISMNGGGQSASAALTTSAVNALRFLESSGNMSTGAFYLYGLRKS